MSHANTLPQITATHQLLRALATGGRRPILELSDWEDRLAAKSPTTSVSRWYLAALHCEWQPASPPSTLCAMLTEDVEAHLSTRSGHWATILGHVLRVAGNAVWLAERSNVDPEAAYLAALYHDYGKLDQWESGLPHAELGARQAARVLAGELPSDDVEAIHDAIITHPQRPPPSWRVARVLHDADKLDKIGATGLIRRVSKTQSLDDACEGAERTLDEAAYFPTPCLAATDDLLNPKLAFAHTLERLLDAACEGP